MRKLVISDQNGSNVKNDILEKLFAIREEEIESSSKERNEFIRENNLKDVTHDILINEIKKIYNTDENTKQKILNMLDKLLENRSKIKSFDCKVYYYAGINDIIDIIFGKSQFSANKD